MLRAADAICMVIHVTMYICLLRIYVYIYIDINICMCVCLYVYTYIVIFFYMYTNDLEANKINSNAHSAFG